VQRNDARNTTRKRDALQRNRNANEQRTRKKMNSARASVTRCNDTTHAPRHRNT
jgi:hypothetical protein